MSTQTGHHHQHAAYTELPPWQRPAEPDHPMSLEGGIVDGDTRLMLRILCEELLMTGVAPDMIRNLSRDGHYQAFAAARAALGEAAANEIIEEAIARIGIHRCASWEATGSAQPASLTVSAPTTSSSPHASPCGAGGERIQGE